MMIKKFYPIISDKRTITHRVFPKASTLLVAGLMLSSCLTTSLHALPGDEEDPRSSSKPMPPKKRPRSYSTHSGASSITKDDGREVKRIKSSAEISLQAQNELANPAQTEDAQATIKIANYTAALDMRDDNGQAVCTGQDRAMTLYNRGNAYARQSQWDPAIDDFTAALEMRDANGQYVYTGQNRAAALNTRGVFYARQSQWDPAIADFTAELNLRDAYGQAVCTGHNRARSLLNRGYAYIAQSQWDPAIADYTAALDLRNAYGQAVWTGQNRAKTLLNRGNAYRAQSQWALAIADYTAALDLQDNKGHFILGEDAGKSLLHKRAEAHMKLANQDMLESKQKK